jgi:hypothetical protein
MKLSSSLELPRPILLESAKLLIPPADPELLQSMRCPRRPKWNYEMSKLEVERNEEGIFKNWLANLDATVAKWQLQSTNENRSESTAMPKSPTYFERNLDVWRQLKVPFNRSLLGSPSLQVASN